MAKKKKEKRPGDDEKAKIREIYADQDHIELVARRMYESGQGVSVIKIYREIQSRHHLPGMYTFAYGDAIKDILREAGWMQGR